MGMFLFGFCEASDSLATIHLLSRDVRNTVSGFKPPHVLSENTISTAIYEHYLFILCI